MMHTHFHSTARSSSFREARPCFHVIKVSTAPGDILPSVDFNYEGLKKDFYAFVEKHAPTKEDFNRWTDNATSFFKEVPFLAGTIHTFSALMNFEAAQKMVSHEEWIKAFQEPNIFETGDTVLKNQPILGPKELLQSMDVVQRRQIYLEYTKTFIATPVQQDMYGPEWNDAKLSQEERFKLARKTPGLTDSVLRGSMGMEDDTPTADMGKVYAADSLRYHYNLSKNGIDAPTKGLIGDYQTALRYQKFPGNGSIATDPTILGSELPPSRMKGALNLGAVNVNHLRKAREISVKLEDEKTMAKAEIIKNVDAFKKDTSESVSKRAESLGQTFNGLSGGEKLMVVALGLYAIFGKSKIAGALRGTAAVLAGTYLFQRVVLKQKDPIQEWKDVISSNFNAAKGLMAGDEATKAESLVNFLSPFDRENLELQGTALGYVADSKLSDLASAMEFTGQSTSPIEMNMAPNSKLEASLIAQGATPKSLAFLRTPEMKKGAADGISFVFYSMASKNVVNYEDVQIVEEASRLLGPNQAPSDLFGRETESDPVRREMFRKGADAYRRLVLRGKDIALKSNQTLGAYIADNAVRPLATGARRAPRVAAAAPLAAPLPAATPVVAATPAATAAPVAAPASAPTPAPTSITSAPPGAAPSGPASTPGAAPSGPASTPGAAPSGPASAPGAAPSGPASTPGAEPSGPASAPGAAPSGPASAPGAAPSGPASAPGAAPSGPASTPGAEPSGPASTPGAAPSGPASAPGAAPSGPASTPGAAPSGPASAPGAAPSGPASTPGAEPSGPASAPGAAPSGPASAPGAAPSGPATIPTR